jgi:uncharacterized protein YndB with AHSA1/START domain
MSQLQVAAEGTTSADPATVWSLVADANTYPQWGPWSDGGYRPPSPGPSRAGSTQWFRYGRRTTSVEEILEVHPPLRLVYAVVSGLPVKNYRAEITLNLTPANGTAIRWTATWDDTLLGRLVRRRLRQFYPELVSALVAAADHYATAEPPTIA